jgi:RNA polymerase sigma factor (sigma-70 family)
MHPPEANEAQNVEKFVLYERYADTMLTYICQQVSNRQDAEDLLLEVFLAALSNTSLVELPAARQLAWLRHVARNKVIDHYRHGALFAMQPLEQVERVQQEVDQRLSPDRQAEEQEKLTWLSQAIDQLPADQRELIRLRYVQELRLTQIAALMQKSEGTVRKMLSRTLRRLKSLYDQYERRGSHV